MFAPNIAAQPLISGRTQWTGLYHHNYRAVLHVFFPRRFGASAIRPLTMHFTNNLMNSAVDQVVNGTSTSRHRLQSIMQTPDAAQAILPSTQRPIPVGTHLFSDHYTFTLIVDNEPSSGGVIGAYGNGVNTRRSVYHGYFIDEPINPLTFHSTQPTLNPTASMVIVHRSLGSQIGSQNAYGMTYHHQNQADESVVPFAALKNVTGQPRLFLSTPEKLWQSIDVDGHQNQSKLWMGPAFADMTTEGQAVPVSTEIQRPDKVLPHIINAAIRSYDSFRAQSSDYTDQMMSIFQDNVLMDSMGVNLSSHSSFRQLSGLDVGQVYTAGHVYNLYKFEVMPWREQASTMWGTIDQMENSERQVFGYMIATSIPAILARHNLTSISFRYNSHVDGLGEMVPSYNGFVPLGQDSLFPMTAEQTAFAVQSVLTELREGTFRSILYARGHFDVQLVIGQGHFATVTLNFLDSPWSDAPLELPTILGGFTCNQVADQQTAQDNSGQFGELINNIIGTQHAVHAPIPDHLQPLNAAGYQQDRNQLFSSAVTDAYHSAWGGDDTYPISL